METEVSQASCSVMADADQLCETIMRELDDMVLCDGGDTEEELEEPSSLQDTVSDDIPPSLLRYFERSKSRAVRSEKLILEELEDFSSSHHNEDMKNFPDDLDMDMMKKPATFDTETHLLFSPRETQAPFPHDWSACPGSEDEAETSPEKDERIQQRTEFHEEHRETRHCEEMRTEERRRQSHRDFQEELEKIIKAEKLQQRELELRKKRAQEKLEQEFLLQQELISSLQKRVTEARKRREEEQRSIKEEGEKKRKEEEEARRRREEDRRKMEEETIKREKEKREMMEEQMRRKKEEEEKRKIKEIKLKEELRRKREEELRKLEEEERRRIEEIKLKEELRRKREEELRKLEEEERRRIEEIKLKEELRKKREEELRILEEEEKRRIEEIKVKEELRRKRDEEKRIMEEEEKRRIEEIKVKEELRRREEEEKRIHEEQEKWRKEEERMMTQEVMRKTEEEKTEIGLNEEEKMRQIEGEVGERKQNGEKIKGREKNSESEEEVETRVKDMMMAKMMEGDEKRKNEEVMVQVESRKKGEQQDIKNGNEEEERRTPKELVVRTKTEEKGGNIEEEAMAQQTKLKEEEKRDIKEMQLKEGGEKRKKEEERKHSVECTVDVLIQRENLHRRDTKKEQVKTPEEDKRPERDVRKQQEEEQNNAEEEMRLKKEMEQNEDKMEEKIKMEERRLKGEQERKLDPNKKILSPSASQTVQQQDGNTSPRTSSCSLPVCLPEHADQKRLAWMRDCIPWSKLSLQNKSRERVHARRRRGRSRTSEACRLPPLCPQTLLQSTGCTSLREVTTVTLEDLHGCSFASLAQCPHLQSLTLRRCGLKSLEGFSQLPRLCSVDVQENSISFVDCENMAALQVLRLGHNQLTSIHGLSGADNLSVLDLSHNSITRIAGLDSVRRLQSLSLAHNQLISTKGLRDVCTLLHLDCSHNHLASVQGLENCALLQTLALRSNSLTEPPSVNDHILLRELHLDDNSISSLQGLAVCWLPLMHHLSAAENRITLLPSMSDFVSLTKLDLRFNCMSELPNVCEAVKGCLFLEEVHLSGNPLQQETGWRGTLQRAVPGLRAIDGEETEPFLSAPAVRQLSLAPGSFLTFCQAQLKQMRDLQQRHSRELSNAPTPLDAVRSSCRHLTEAFKLAVDQRFAHEYGDTIVCAEQTLGTDSAAPKKHAELSETGSTEKSPPVINRTNIKWTLAVPSLATMEITNSSPLKMVSASKHQDLDQKTAAAVVIQQRWRKYRQKRGNISSPPAAEEGGERGGDGGTPESGSSDVDRSAVGQDYAATIIQAFWRGCALRRRLATALAAVTCLDSREDEAFEEVDVDGFAFDEATLEKHWTLPLSEQLSSRHHYGSPQPLSLKPPGPFPEVSQHALPPSASWRPKQAWVVAEQLDSTGMKVSPASSIRSKSPASTGVLSGLSARSEKILQEWGFQDSNTAILMLKRAQKMRSKKHHQKKHKAPSVCLALYGNCKYQQAPVEARNRPALRNRHHMKVCRVEVDLQQAEQTEQVRQERAQQWLQNQSDGDSESEHFLPEISSAVLNGGRVQLVADPAKAERLHHASGLWASSSLDAQPCKERNYPCSNSLGHARKKLLSPHRVKSAPSRKERISFRDIPVQLSSGWGGGKKRDKVYK